MKKCPYCSKEIAESASFCLYCMQPLDEKAEIKPQKTRPRRELAFIVVIAVLLLALSVSAVFLFRDGKGGKHPVFGSGISSEEMLETSSRPETEGVSSEPNGVSSEDNNFSEENGSSSSETSEEETSSYSSSKVKDETTKYVYREVPGGIEICGSTDWGKRIFIVPSELNGKTVVGICQGLSLVGNQRLIILPDTVQYLSDNAFTNLRAKEIVIPKSVKSIGASAFKYARIEAIYIASPDVVLSDDVFTPIEEKVYDFTIYAPASVMNSERAARLWGASYVEWNGEPVYMGGEESFSYVEVEGGVEIKGLKNISAFGAYEIPKAIEGKPVVGIGKGAFSGGYIPVRDVKLPSSLKYIARSAFSGTGITSIVIPKSVILIESYAFSSAENLTSIYIASADVEIQEGAFMKKQTPAKTIYAPSSVMNKQKAWEMFMASYVEWNG